MRGSIASLYLAIATATAIWTSAPANAHFAPIDQPKTSLTDVFLRDRNITAESNHYCLALAVYFEGGSTEETEEGQRHIAHVVVERARANRRVWGGSNICDVVFYKRGNVCQFSFACLPLAKRTVRGGHLWSFSRQIAREELEGRNAVEAKFIRYYMNASLTPAKNACRFRKEFVPVVQVGRHEFFREATRDERRELATAEHNECKKYEASLKKKKLTKNNKSHKKDGVAVAKKQTAKKVTVAKR